MSMELGIRNSTKVLKQLYEFKSFDVIFFQMVEAAELFFVVCVFHGSEHTIG